MARWNHTEGEQAYADLWVPRLIPYYEDLVKKAAPRPDERALVTCVGPGAELAAIANTMQQSGFITATDASETMIQLAKHSAASSNIKLPVEFCVADARDTFGAKWDVVLSAFSIWHLEDRVGTLKAWREALGVDGRIGILAWGPPDPTGPFELLESALHSLEPDIARSAFHRRLAERQAMTEMLAEAGLRLIRHAVVRHPMQFGSAQGFFKSLCNGSGFLRGCDRLNTARLDQVADSFFARLQPPSPHTPLHFTPAATVAIAAPIPSEQRTAG